jgi:hypothetical protein
MENTAVRSEKWYYTITQPKVTTLSTALELTTLSNEGTFLSIDLHVPFDHPFEDDNLNLASIRYATT